MKNWYIVQTFSGFENKVAETLKDKIKVSELSDKIEEVMVPIHEVTEVKRGKRVQRKKKYFPGYVLIKSEMDNNIYHMIKNIKKVSGFLGSKGTPIPVSDKEIEKILGQIKDGVAQLVERRSQKPEVGGSIPSAPAKNERKKRCLIL